MHHFKHLTLLALDVSDVCTTTIAFFTSREMSSSRNLRSATENGVDPNELVAHDAGLARGSETAKAYSRIAPTPTLGSSGKKMLMLTGERSIWGGGDDSSQHMLKFEADFRRKTGSISSVSW